MLRTSLIFSFSVLFLILSFPREDGQMGVDQIGQEKQRIEISGKVEQIINSKCLSCHMPQSENKSAKRKLQWGEVEAYNLRSQQKFVKRLKKVLEKEKMPPKKYIEQFPEMRLTSAETEILMSWLKGEEDRLEDR